MRDKLGIVIILLLGLVFALFYSFGFQQKSVGLKLSHQPAKKLSDQPKLLGEINLREVLGNKEAKPVGIQVWEGKLWVSLFGDAKVQVMSLEGLPLRKVELKDSQAGFKPNQMAFTEKTGVFSDWQSGSLVFRDAKQGKVDYFNQLPDGTKLEPQGVVAYKDVFYIANPVQKGWFAITGQGEVITGVDGRKQPDEGLEFPFGLAVTKDGRVVITDPVDGKVKFYSCVGWFGGTLDQGQFQNPMGIALDSMQRMHIVDNGKKQVLVLDEQGNYLFAYGQNLVGPTVVAVDSKTRAIYIADTEGGKIQVWGY